MSFRTILPFLVSLFLVGECWAQSTSHSYTDLLCVRSVNIQGNDRTKDDIIFREMTFKLGNLYQRADLDIELERTRQNIFNLDLFISTTIKVEEIDSDVNLTIVVKERLYLLPLPIFFLADRSFNEWWYDRGRDLRRTTYGVQLNHSNLTGNADELRLKTYFGFVPYYEISYNRPYIDRRQRMGLQVGAFFSTQKTLAYRTWNDKLDFFNSEDRTRQRFGAFVEYSLRNALYHSHKIRTGFTDIQISDTIKVLNENYLGANGNELKYGYLTYEYQYNKVDNFQYPLTGQRLLARVSKYGLGIAKDVNQLDILARYQRFFKLKPRLFFDFSLSGKISFPQLQLYPLVRGLGFGSQLVRGYQLNVIDGQQYALLRTNFKYKVFEKEFNLSKILKIKQFNSLPISSFMKVFADAGAVRNFYPELSNSTLSNKLLLGGGIGMDIVTFYNTSFDINYSFNQIGNGRLFFTARRSF